MKNPFEDIDQEYVQDMGYLDSVSDTPTDEEWVECMKICYRTWDRLFQLTYIEGGAKSRN